MSNEMKINLFEIDEDAEFGQIAEDTDSNDDDSGSNDTNDDSDSDDSVDDTETFGNDDQDDDEENEEDSEEEEESEVIDVDKTIASYIKKGYLFLPDDYEYEDTPEAIQKAFEDSEKYRDQAAIEEAIKFLTSEEGLDLVKIKESKSKIKKYADVDVYSADDNTKINTLKEYYKSKGFDEDETAEKIEDLEELDKTDKEFKKALSYMQDKEEKEIAAEADKLRNKRKEEKENFEKSQKLIKETLDKGVINGYAISKESATNIMKSIYTPVQKEDGTAATTFNEKLSAALQNPNTLLVLADMLNNMTDDGFEFKDMKVKATSDATKIVKKSIRDLKNTNTKSKVSGKQSQSKKDFDLSKATLFQI
jgi:hypothetical protein